MGGWLKFIDETNYEMLVTREAYKCETDSKVGSYRNSYGTYEQVIIESGAKRVRFTPKVEELGEPFEGYFNGDAYNQRMLLVESGKEYRLAIQRVRRKY